MVALFILFRHNTACEYSWLCASKRQDAAVALPPWQSGEAERGATACQSPAASLPSTSSVVWLRLRANLLSTHPTVQRQGRRRWSDGTQTQKETRRQREGRGKGRGEKEKRRFVFETRTYAHARIYIFIYLLDISAFGFIFAERDGSGDHNAFEEGDATERRELCDASKPGLFLRDGRDILMLRNWRITTLRRRDVLQLPGAAREDECLPWRHFSLVICRWSECSCLSTSEAHKSIARWLEPSSGDATNISYLVSSMWPVRCPTTELSVVLNGSASPSGLHELTFSPASTEITPPQDTL